MSKDRHQRIRAQTNISYLVDLFLEQNQDFDYIGRLFTETLVKRKTDTLAFQHILNPVRNQRIKSGIMKDVKVYFQIALNEGYEPPEEINIQRRIVNNNSLLGVINGIITERGEQAFDFIGRAVQEGSQEYLRANPLAKQTNYQQFKEYHSILAQLQQSL